MGNNVTLCYDIMAKGDFDIEYSIQAIIDGKRLDEIAKHFNMPLSTLHYNLCKPEFSARVKTAMATSAATYANMGELVLQTAPPDKVEMMRARELAQHYRWMAGKRNPKEYGDRVQNDVSITEVTSRVIKTPGGSNNS